MWRPRCVGQLTACSGSQASSLLLGGDPLLCVSPEPLLLQRPPSVMWRRTRALP